VAAFIAATMIVVVLFYDYRYLAIIMV